MAPRKAMHEQENVKDYTRPVSKPTARPKHDFPENPKAYGKPNVPSSAPEMLDQALDQDTEPPIQSPYTGRQ